MKVKIPLLLLVLLAAAVGYLLGTEKGRAQRDLIVVKVRERRAREGSTESPDEDETIDITEATEDAESASESGVAPVS